MDGKLVIFSAPSGAGKTTIVRYLLERDPRLQFSISATSRTIRGNESNGVDYYFFDAGEFRQMIGRDEFVEWEEVYTDHYYGTLRSEIERIWEEGKHVLFDVDVKGGINLKKQFGDRAISLFVMPPSVEALRERLRKRGTDSADKIEMRVKKALEEIERAPEFDHIVINDDLGEACSMAEELVNQFLGEGNIS